MRLLIVEDEPPIARHIEWCCRTLLEGRIRSLRIAHTFEDAQAYLSEHPIDLCLLDLNLRGKTGFDLLRHAVSGSFHTIVISAYTDQAIEAFEYGVLDFVPKPVHEDRLRLAFDRYSGLSASAESKLKYFTVRVGKKLNILPVDEIVYFKAANIYVEAVLNNGRVELLDKKMDRLEQTLPARFIRVHRSYIVDLGRVDFIRHKGGGSYALFLKDGRSLPVSRHRKKALQDRIVRHRESDA